MDTPETKKRRSRFTRVSLPPFELQDRDTEIIRQVFKHRFLRTSHLTALVEGSDQQISRRLQILYHNQFLDRPRIQSVRTAANRELTHALGNRGADLLARLSGTPRDKIDWTDKNNVKDKFYEHTLMVADVMVGMELSCRRHGTVALIEPEEILAQAPLATRTRKEPYSWKVRLQGEPVSVTIVPDKVFGLHYTQKTEGGNKGYFFLEADRGTMPVSRSNLKWTSMVKKVKEYHATVALWENEKYRSFHFQHFRILTVTRPKGRIENLIKATRETLGKHNHALRRFLFVELDTLTTSDLLTMEWRNGRDEKVTLLE